MILMGVRGRYIYLSYHLSTLFLIMRMVNTYKYCNIRRFDISTVISPVNPLEDKFLIILTFTIS